MVWQLHGSYFLGVANNEITLPTNFMDEYLGIKVVLATPPTGRWRYFGELEQLATLPAIGETILSTTKLKLKPTRIRVDNSIPYEIRLIAYHWLPDLTIEVYRDI
jgi:hypothetical protein